MAGNFQHPFQCIQFIERQPAGLQDLLIASAGPRVYSYAAGSGQRLAIWPQNVAPSASENPNAGPESTSEGQAPPEKKRKVSPSGNETNEGPRSTSEEPGKVSVTWSTVPLLVPSSDGKYVVALTGEDKTIRVLKVEDEGSLKQLSARCMPKKPSAVALTSDDSTILSADKFGDVYTLPLIPSDNPTRLQRNWRQTKPTGSGATNLTVHTKRNLASLEQQRQSRENAKQEKTGPDFENELILGHVSLLTDLALASLESSNGKRSYILTADRDEHIRVSRGLPQPHVIESYCLGHTSFISTLCIPHWASEILVSGGGDNYLLVWKWLDGRVLQKVPLVDPASENTEVAVRGIWATSLADSADPSKSSKIILVALEGSSKLLSYILEANGTLKSQDPIEVSGNVLSVTSMEKNGVVLVSVDGVREAGSTQAWRTNPASAQALVEAFRAKPGAEGLQWEAVTEGMASSINSEGTSSVSTTLGEKQQKEMDESLYGLGNLRKRVPGEDD